jgi:hypothetical protein
MKRRLVALGLLVLACDRSAPGVVQTGEFGVFFGGQVQELKAIAKELDPARQQHGFRLTFRGPLEKDIAVSWEISRPATDKGGPRAASVGQTTAKAGQGVLDVPLSFRPTDPLGSWHAKVTAAGVVVIDRDFDVVAPSSQKSAPKSVTPRSTNP